MRKDNGRPRRRPRWWAGAALLITLVWLFGAGTLGMFLGRLGEVQTNDPGAFLPVGAESTEVSEIAEGFDREEAVPAVVVYSGGGDIAEDDLAAIAGVGERVAGEPWAAGPVIGPF
ncbi:hypothetical protein Q7689_35415, partial [Nocardiopsis tropica]|nr:hypothetical protein [Nocardiopsis tropica]